VPEAHFGTAILEKKPKIKGLKVEQRVSDGRANEGIERNAAAQKREVKTATSRQFGLKQKPAKKENTKNQGECYDDDLD
jgi:hypothetical protein